MQEMLQVVRDALVKVATRPLRAVLRRSDVIALEKLIFLDLLPVSGP
jgi:hypothetical protein